MTAPFRGSSSEFSRQQLRGRKYQWLSRDVYLLRDSEADRQLDLRTRVDAAKVVFTDGIPCLTTAALLLKLPVDDDGRVHLARGVAASRSEREGVVVHRLPLLPTECHDLDGLLVADGPRTLTDLAASMTLEQLVAVGDVVLKRWGEPAVATAVARCGGRRGAVLLRQAVPLFDAGSDSPAETRARLRLHAAGFTGLQHNVVVRDFGGGWLCEPDLADETAKVGLQHEGVVHFEKGEKQRRSDLDRDELARLEDWQIVSSTAIDDARPDRLVAKMTAAYRRAAQLWGPHVLPAHLSPDRR